MRLFLFSLLLILPVTAAAQGAPPWQQRVAYEMDIVMDAPAHQFDGTQRLTLQNNSPDTLTHVYYHLYFNAFQPQSLMAERNRHLPDPDARVVPRIFELGPDEIGWQRVESLEQDGVAVPFRINDTILRADLARPIPPGESATFEMRFRAQVPLQTRRSGRDSREGIDFSMSQWYPKLANYDARGWHPDAYIGREFYAPFGTFDVRITIPAEYTLGATGVLQNADEIGHGYGRRDVTHAPGAPLTWHFRAENVHDFAWVADRDYVHDRIEHGSVTYHLLYQPDAARGWQQLRPYVPAMMQYLSHRVGPYPYPQFTVAQAGDGGMEYPMINFITGGRVPGSLYGVTTHEAAHEWFYGVLGSNETQDAWMDEGFTEFITAETIAALLLGEPANHRRATLTVLEAQENGLFEPLSSPSDWFDTNRGYASSAYRGGNMVADLLGYVITDSLRDEWLREYFRQYKFRHPQPADVERVAEQVSGLELDWFFQQLTRENVRMDYAVAGLSSKPNSGAWETEVKLQRRDRMVMPIDLRLRLADGSEQWVTIPTSEMHGAKAVPANWITAPAWGWTYTGYTLRVNTPQKVVSAEIDPMHRTPDHNRLNNATRMPNDVAFLRAPTPSLEHYSTGWRPLAVYADRFGGGIGVQARGTYWMGRHRTKAMLTLYPQAFDTDALAADRLREWSAVEGVSRRQWYDAVDYTLAYETGLRRLSPHTRLALSADKHVGVLENRAELSHTFGRFAALGRTRGTVRLYGVHLLQPSVRGFAYDNVSVFGGDHMTYLGASYEAGRGFDRFRASLDIGGSLRGASYPFLDADGNVVGTLPLERFSATRFTIEAQKQLPLGPLALRAKTLLGFGSDRLAPYRRFRMGTVPLERVWRNTAARQIAALDDDLANMVHYDVFSGVGPVAYSLARQIEMCLDTPDICALATSIAARRRQAPSATQAWMGSLELALPRVRTPLLSPLEVTAFAGAGINAGAGNDGRLAGTNTRPFSFDNLIADGGFGVTYDVSRVPALRRWTAQSDFLQTLRLAARFPVWASNPELIAPDEKAFAFRYLVGVEVGL